MKEVIIYTDEFLTDTLHYALGRGDWNKGDGHTWIIDIHNYLNAKSEIKRNFALALDNLFGDALRGD